MIITQLRIGLFGALFCLAYAGSSCQKPSITVQSTIADDATFHHLTAFSVEFRLKCQNDAKPLPLFAEMAGRVTPVAASQEASGSYQISWTKEHDKATAEDYVVNIHDEEGISAVRKAIRNKEKITNIQPLGTFTVSHKGASKGPWVQSQMFALAMAIAVYIFAFTTKSKIQS